MATIKPFVCIRPNEEVVREVASLPYDVYDRKEAKEKVAGHPLAFLNIDRPETMFDDDVDMYSQVVYDKARQTLESQISDGTYVTDECRSLFIYEQTVEESSSLTMLHGRSQTGIVCCCLVDEYVDGTIKKHENTRADKEEDRIRHIDTLSAQTGPIFLAYRNKEKIDDTVSEVKKSPALYDFVSDDGIRHRVWRVCDGDIISRLTGAFESVPHLYIADGHHRAASAVKVGLKRRAQMDGGMAATDMACDTALDSDDSQGSTTREHDLFLAIVFPDSDLNILPYNRAVKDLHGLTEDEFMARVAEHFEIKAMGDATYEARSPRQIGMYIGRTWYELKAKHIPQGVVESLDVSILQDSILSPILGIEDPRTDSRITFVGGIRGSKELVRLVDSGDYAVAFAMYPTTMGQLLSVADADLLMPPKSTWFEPKLRSGIFIHGI